MKMERTQLINYARIVTDIFLIIVIGLLVWQFLKADAITKDIALSSQPAKLVQAYENITGLECVCGDGIKDICLTKVNLGKPK